MDGVGWRTHGFGVRVAAQARTVAANRYCAAVRILYLNNGFLPGSIGGVELHLYQLARILGERGHQSLVVYRALDHARLEYELERDRFEALDVARINHRCTEVRDLDGILSVQGVDRRLIELIEEFRPDLVHVHHFTTLSTGWLEELRRRAIPLVITLHDFWMGCPRGQRIREDLSVCPTIDLRRCDPCLRHLWPHCFEEPPAGLWARITGARYRDLNAYHRQVRATLCSADRLIVPSRFAARLYQEYGLPVERLEVIPYGLATDHLTGLAREPEQRLRIGYIGTVIPSKGVHVLLDAFLCFPEGAARLSIHGEVFPFHHDTTYGERLEAARAGREDVRFHGRYAPEQLPEILAQLDVLVVPSIWYETYCMALREGFLAGLPVVASNHGALAEAIEPGVTGLLFEPGNAEDLFVQLERLLKEPALRQRLASAPKQVWNHEQNADAVWEVYQRVGPRAG